MKVNDIVESKKTKNRYRVAGTGKMKLPGDDTWLDSVVYESFQDYAEDSGYVAPKETVVYIREMADFESEFEPSVPKIQIFDKNTGNYIYDFGISENLLVKYFEAGFGLRSSVLYKESLGDLPTFCQILAGDILIGGMDKADERISQELLDAIRGDVESGTFGRTAKGMIELQNLLYFLAIPGSGEENKQ